MCVGKEEKLVDSKNPINKFHFLWMARVLVFLLPALLIIACGDGASTPPITDVPVDDGNTATVTREATVSSSKTDVPQRAGGTATVAPGATASPSKTDIPVDVGDTTTVTSEPTALTFSARGLHPSSYIDCEGLALYDSMFHRAVSSTLIALHYFNLQVVTDDPYFMYCKGMAVFETRRTPEREPPHERLIIAQLIPEESIQAFLNARRGDLYLNVVPIEDVYISIVSGVESSDSK